ncbi:anti-sigma factor [Alcaligenes faecalis]|uniref:anti-sigma factor domain-containing protein n=1 Tax=Alcaligenes TaxID=507 RepID=UPI00203C6CCE|nr:MULTISPECIES: anti-sigma factor [Alcaligenes]MCM2560221.1 anti-sigma factor [Alcaligenes faecalis]MCM2622863.1 anti-sigma factor [Alcaligenes faecalis]MDH4867107.1 anti-sigma factor [Bacillus cereus]MDY7128412.1 anti-sigma factor [Alcaligenes nematophilus]
MNPFTVQNPSMPSSSFSYSSSLDQLAAQDSQALDVLYDQEAPLMLALGQAVLGRRIDAEEVLRDSFVLLWKNAAGYDPDLGEGRAWIYSILRFRLLARLRQRAQSGDSNYALPAIKPQAGQRFIPAMGKLDGTSQRAMIHAYLHGNSYEQLGPQLNRSPAQLRAVVQHGLQQLTPLINEGNANDPRHAVMIGEYTLGLLSQHELVQAHTLMQQNDQAARLALAWEQAWLELVDCLTPTVPAPTSLAHIHHTLGLPPPAARRQAGNTSSPAAEVPKSASTGNAGTSAPVNKAERQEPSIKTSTSADQATKAEAATRTEPRWSVNSSNDKADDHTPPFPTLLRADSDPATKAAAVTAEAAPTAPAKVADKKKPAKSEPESAPVEKKRKPEPVDGERKSRGFAMPMPVLWGGLAAVVILGLVIALLMNMNSEPPVNVIEMKPRQAAILQAPGQSSTPAWIATVDPQGNVLLVPKVSTEVKATQSVQLWTHTPRGTQVRSLGLIDPNRPITVPAALIGTVEDEQIFEMTLETEGGSNSGAPEGPVLYIGRIVSFGQLDNLPKPNTEASSSATRS